MIMSQDVAFIQTTSSDARCWKHCPLNNAWASRCKIQHFASRLSPKMSRSAAPATKSPTRTSPNTAPATQNECHHWSASHMKRHFQCVEQVKSPSNITKYCACHAKGTSSMICVTYATSFPLRGASKGTLQPHQIMRLPLNLEAQDFSGNLPECFRQ